MFHKVFLNIYKRCIYYQYVYQSLKLVDFRASSFQT